MQPKQKGKRTYRPYEFRQRQGGSSTIKPQSIYRYVNRLRLREEPQLVDPVVKFRAEILNDPVLRMNFNQTVLESLPEHVDESTGDKFRLLGNNIEEAMVRVNTAATSAPKFEDSEKLKTLTHSFVAKENWPLTVQFNNQGDEKEDRDKEENQDRGKHNIEASFGPPEKFRLFAAAIIKLNCNVDKIRSTGLIQLIKGLVDEGKNVVFLGC